MEKKIQKEKRRIRTYKATDHLYDTAKKMAMKKEKKGLATKIEELLYDYISR
jgi:hypothetical protein